MSMARAPNPKRHDAQYITSKTARHPSPHPVHYPADHWEFPESAQVHRACQKYRESDFIPFLRLFRPYRLGEQRDVGIAATSRQAERFSRIGASTIRDPSLGIPTLHIDPSIAATDESGMIRAKEHYQPYGSCNRGQNVSRITFSGLIIKPAITAGIKFVGQLSGLVLITRKYASLVSLAWLVSAEMTASDKRYSRF